MAAVEQPPPSIPERRRRSPEIIDVDEFVDDIAIRPTQRRRVTHSSDHDVIVILDSDDEDMVHAGPSQPRGLPHNPRRMPTPSYVRQTSVIPPVPPLPRHLHSQRSMPMRRHPPSHPTGIIRPNDHPFNFEATMDVRQARREVELPPLYPAPPSHHAPVMGFGGALLAMRGGNGVQPASNGNNRPLHGRVPRASRHNNFWSVGNVLENIFARYDEEAHFNEADRMGADGDRQIIDILRQDYAMLRDGNRHYSAERPLFFSDSNSSRRVRHFEPEYKPTYTHRGKPAPGFTFDFAPPTAESSATASSASATFAHHPPGPGSSGSGGSSPNGDNSSTILVCARCVDPLVTSDSVTGEEHTRRKIWALRCGHMLDGKCVEEIIKPDMGASSATGSGETEKRKPDKGKGKAMDITDLFTSPSLSPSPEPNTIRSRLRPRPGSGVAPSLTHALSSASTRTNGKAKAKGPQVEAEHVWVCPVAGCGQRHGSLLVAGEWMMDNKTGAIVMYV